MKLKVPPVFVLLIAVVILKAVQMLTPDVQFVIPFGIYIGYSLMGLGGLIGFLGIMEFRKHKTTTDPTQPQKASTVVTSGIYQYTRNPMYLGMAVILIGWVIHYGNPLSVIAVVFLVGYLTQFQIKPEEEILKQHFGQAYEDYLRKVRRWI